MTFLYISVILNFILENEVYYLIAIRERLIGKEEESIQYLYKIDKGSKIYSKPFIYFRMASCFVIFILNFSFVVKWSIDFFILEMKPINF